MEEANVQYVDSPVTVSDFASMPPWSGSYRYDYDLSAHDRYAVIYMVNFST